MIEVFIQHFLANIFDQDELKDCFHIETKTNSSGKKIEVFVDCDSGLSLKKCSVISRKLEKELDEKNYFGGKYILEISSPGLDRPLQVKRQYLKNLNRKMDVELVDSTRFEGTLTGIEGDILTFEKELSKKQAKKLGKKVEIQEVNFEKIEKTFIKISFK